MLYFFIKSQLALFDAPINVSAFVRKDGTVVKPHVRIAKVSSKPHINVQASLFGEHKDSKPRHPKLDKFIDKHGGIDRLSQVLNGMQPHEKQVLYSAMAKLDDMDGKYVESMFTALDGASTKNNAMDLFGLPVHEEQTPVVISSIKPEPVTQEIIEHVTGKGKTLRGIVRTDINQAQAKEIDQYTFRKNGGWFIREKHLSGVAPVVQDIVPVSEKVAIVSMHEVNQPIMQDDPNALDKVHAKLKKKQDDQATMKLANLYIRRGDDAGLKDMGFSETVIKQLKTKDQLGRVGFKDYEIKNNSAEITRLKKRMDQLIAKQAPAEEIIPHVANSEVTQVPEVAIADHGPFGVLPGTSKTKRREINAIAFDLINSGSDMTDADRSILRQYSGNGGCGDSLNEYYTDPAIASAMWEILDKLGISTGTVLEPSCATGVFMHTAPSGIKVTGVELDPTSAAISEVLHGAKHEIINSSLERFATTDGNRQFDAVIGNAPFGIRGSLIKDDKSFLKTAEGYFLDTSLDKCKPGGIVAMIVPTGVIDSGSARAVRQRLLCKGEFLGAVRMPNTAFEHSHTEVTTDIIYFKKRPNDVAGALLTLDKNQLKKIGVWDEEYLSGAYFSSRGAHNIFGVMEDGWRAKAGIGQDITVSGSMIGVPEAVAAWVPNDYKTSNPSMQDILSVVGDNDALRKKVLGNAIKMPYEHARAGDTKVEDGVTYIMQGSPLRWHRVDEFIQTPEVTQAQDLARDIESAINGGSKDGLSDRVKAYVDEYGIPGKNKNLLIAASQDKILYRLIGAVSLDGTLSDVVVDRAKRKVESSFDVAAQALALEDGSGLFTVAKLAERMGRKDDDELEDMLLSSSSYAYAGNGQYTTMDSYLTGELWPKLDKLHAAMAHGDLREGVAEKYALQYKKLEEAIDPKSLEDVEIAINSAFIPTAIIEAYLNDKKNNGNKWEREQPDISVKFDGGWYTITGGNEYSTKQKLLSKYLNRDGVGKDDFDEVQEMNAEFKSWLLGSNYRDQVEDLYNRKFRGFIQKEFSDETINIPGMNTDGLKQYQYSGLRWAMSAGKGIIAADVGLGKTVRGLMLARMAKINGSIKRPMFVVPKSVLANWVSEAERWFPGSRILVVGETYSRDKDGNLKSKSDTADIRNQKLHDMRQNDYDFIFVSQPSFNDIDLDPIVKGQYVNSDFWVQRGDKKGNEGDKRIKKIREAYNQAIANREFQKRTDAVYWDDLDVDMLIVDESHNYKNLFSARDRFGESPKFLGGSGQSMRAFDMQMKTRYLRDHHGGKGVFMLTATPTKNSPLEIYSMLSHVAPEAFEKIGIRNSEEFLDRFCTFEHENILTTSGKIEDALVTSGFKNLGELREIMRRYIDRKTADDVGLTLPERDDRMHIFPMSEAQEEVYSGLRQDLVDSAKKKDASGDAHTFSIISKMDKAAMDLEILDPELYGKERSPKYEEVAKEIVSSIKDGGQVVFSDSVVAHKKIFDALVKAGVPSQQIAIINAKEADTSAKRQNIADAFNSGKYKVVIGNTATMGEGINLQKATTDIHHLDLPWDPASMQQRNGRGLRQGNIKESVRIHTYMAKGSFDGYRYQSMMAKKDWQDMLWNGGDTVENLSKARFDRNDVMIMMSADPESERAKYEANKAVAMERYDTEQRSNAAAEFQRLELMKHSYMQLKNKSSVSAERLRNKLETAKTKLVSNKYFIAKSALDSKTPTIIEPKTGMALMAGVGIDVVGDDDTTGKWVVTGVAPLTGDISMRRYGTVGKNSFTITSPVSILANGAKPFAFNPQEEAKDIALKIENDAAKGLSDLSDWDHVKSMPSNVLEANNDLLQNVIKSGVKSYKFNMPYGDVPMIDKETGDMKIAASYEHPRLHDTHDYLLPTNAAKEKLIQAWVNAERSAKIGTKTLSGKRGTSSMHAAKTYQDASYDKKHENPVASIMRHVEQSNGAHAYGSKSTLVKEAKARLYSEQMHQIRHAKNMKDAMNAIFPLASVSGASDQYSDKEKHVATYPEKALAMLWARARYLKSLNKPMLDVLGKEHHGYSIAHHSNKSVHNALVGMAIKSGHIDLANAMLESERRHVKENSPLETVQVLGQGYDQSNRTLQSLLRAAEDAGIADKTLNDIRNMNLTGPFSSHRYDASGERKLRDVINERMESSK